MRIAREVRKAVELPTQNTALTLMGFLLKSHVNNEFNIPLSHRISPPEDDREDCNSFGNYKFGFPSFSDHEDTYKPFKIEELKITLSEQDIEDIKQGIENGLYVSGQRRGYDTLTIVELVVYYMPSIQEDCCSPRFKLVDITYQWGIRKFLITCSVKED